MGTTVKAHLCVGALLNWDDIFVWVDHPSKGCDQCPHAMESGFKFCSECGCKLVTFQRKEWSPAMLKYLAEKGLNYLPDEVSECLVDVRQRSYCGSEPEWAIAEVIGVVGTYDSAEAVPIPLKKIEDASKKVRETLSQIGLPDREVSVFLVLYIS